MTGVLSVFRLCSYISIQIHFLLNSFNVLLYFGLVSGPSRSRRLSSGSMISEAANLFPIYESTPQVKLRITFNKLLFNFIWFVSMKHTFGKPSVMSVTCFYPFLSISFFNYHSKSFMYLKYFTSTVWLRHKKYIYYLVSKIYLLIILVLPQFASNLHFLNLYFLTEMSSKY